MAPPPDTASTRAEDDDHRLPTHVVPRRYELLLAPDAAAGSFTGSVTVEVDVLEATREVTLHALDLDVATAWARCGTDHVEASVEADPDREWIVLQLAEELPVGPAELTLDFTGRMGEQLVGLYRSTFPADGEERFLSVTQFESTHARRAFPCFDEPAFKATFAISLVVPEDDVAVSNAAEVARESRGDGTVHITFAETVRMSTYLVAVVTGPLEVTEPVMVAGRAGDIPLRVVHPPGKGHLCDFALEVGEAALRFFEDWYDLPYPGDKVDLVAVPDFAFGAMENLGCITFREVLVLVDPAGSTPMELQRVADVINHELAHMWFGDLVTMSWWNGIWLNEAFATFMETTASDAFRPEWDVWTTFGLARAAAFDTDALLSTRPIEYEVRDASEAEGMFDILTYEKGCSVVRMLEQYLGADRFRDGIRAYLRRNAWGNTETTDLWDAIEDVTGEPVRRIMDEWIFRGGHPLVTVSAGADGVELSQQRALFDPRAATTPETRDGFPVPAVVDLTGNDGTHRTERVLLEDDRTLPVDGPVATVQANVGGNGFYRTLLPPELRSALAGSDQTPLERFVLVDDTWFAAVAGHVTAGDAMDTVAAVAAGETEPSVWRRISAVCAEWRRLEAGPGRERASEAIRSIAGPTPPVGQLAGLDGRAAEVAGVRLALAGTAGRSPDALAAASELFADTSRPIEPAVAAGALEVVATLGGADEHAEVARRWREAPTPQEEQRHLMALVLTRDPGLLATALALTLDEVRPQDGPYVLRRALAHPELGDAAWRFVSSRWDEVCERFPRSALPRMLEGIRGVTDRGLAAEVEGFLGRNPVATGGRQVDQHVERMWATVAAAERLRS